MNDLVIALDFLTATELEPPEMISLAASHGIRRVNLLVQPFQFLPNYRLLADTATRRSTHLRCRDLGVEVEMIEAFPISGQTDPRDFRPAFETGAYLGARWINLLPRETDPSRLASLFAEAAALAAEYGLATLTEFHRRASLRTLPETVAFLQRFGLDGIRVQVDALHFFRFDGTIDQLAENRDWIGRAQICDGPLMMPVDEQAKEALEHRLPPGEGSFPLAAFLGEMPTGISVGIEVPNRIYSVDERVGRCVAGTRGLIGT